MLGIRTKIIIAFTVCALGGFAFLVRKVSLEVKPRFREALEEALIENAYSLAAIVEAHSQRENELSIDELKMAWERNARRDLGAKIYQLEKTKLDLRVYVTDTNGKVLFHSLDSTQVGQDYSKWNDVVLTLRGEYGARTTRDIESDPNTTNLYIAAPIYINNEIAGVLTIGKPVLHNNRFISAAQDKLWILAAIVACIVLLFAFLTTFWISQPIDKLRKYVLALRQGETTALPDLGKNEISELATMLLEMKSALEGRQYVQHYVQSLSHELKSPLSSIQGASELLSEHKLVQEKGEKFLQNINFESKRMEALIQNILELNNLESSATLKSSEDFKLLGVLDECIEHLQHQFEAKELQIELSCSGTLKARGDRLLLRLAISNLLKNAIDFSPVGSKIALTVTGQNPIQIRVIDQGPGIPEWASDKVFERFFSLPRPDTGRKSSGIGLALTKAIAELHGGQCKVVPTQSGTCVQISLET